MLCCAVTCRDVLSCADLFCLVSCCWLMLCCILVLCFLVLCYGLLCCIVLSCVVWHRVVRCCVALHYMACRASVLDCSYDPVTVTVASRCVLLYRLVLCLAVL